MKRVLDNIFLLSDASYNQSTKIVSIAVKDTYTGEIYTKILKDIKSSMQGEFLALCFAIKLAHKFKYKNPVFIYDCRTLDINSLEIYIKRHFNFNIVQFLWLKRNYLKEPDRLARFSTQLGQAINIKTKYENINPSQKTIDSFMKLELNKINYLILIYLKNNSTQDYDEFLKYLNGTKFKRGTKIKTNFSQLYRFYYQILPRNKKGLFFDYISKTFPEILKDKAFKQNPKNKAKLKHIRNLMQGVK